MNTITKAIIRHKVVDSNKYYVEIPYLQQSSVNNNGITESALEATLAHTPGIINSYNDGDVVFVSFEDTLASKPVILGKLLLDENENRGYAKLNSLDVTGKVSLSKDVTIGDYTIDELLTNAVNSIEIPGQITSIDGLAGGTLTSPLIIKGGDSATASKIILNQNSQGQITDSSTSTLFGFLNSNTLTVGENSYALNLRGSGTRPTYKGNELSLLSDIPTNQATSTVIRDALTNINGRVLSNYEATYYDASQSQSGYAYYHITKNNNNLTEEEAKDYMEYMTGSRFLPTFKYEKPVNSIFIMADGSFWKPQYTQNSGLDLYKIPNPYVTSVKTINEQSIVGSGNVDVGKTTLYKHDIAITTPGDNHVQHIIFTDNNSNTLTGLEILNLLSNNNLLDGTHLSIRYVNYQSVKLLVIGVSYAASTVSINFIRPNGTTSSDALANITTLQVSDTVTAY